MEKNNVITKLTFNDKVNLITNFENWQQQNDLEILAVSKKVIKKNNSIVTRIDSIRADRFAKVQSLQKVI